jgi:hypothetical protein
MRYPELLIHLCPAERVYPPQPYGAEPIIVLYPSPAYAFDNDEPSANQRVGGVKGHEAEQNLVIAAEPAGPAWSIKKTKKPRGDEDDNHDAEDDLIRGFGKQFIEDDLRGDDNLDDDVIDPPHDGLTVKDIEDDDAEDEDNVSAS